MERWFQKYIWKLHQVLFTIYILIVIHIKSFKWRNKRVNSNSRIWIEIISSDDIITLLLKKKLKESVISHAYIFYSLKIPTKINDQLWVVKKPKNTCRCREKKTKHKPNAEICFYRCFIISSFIYTFIRFLFHCTFRFLLLFY